MNDGQGKAPQNQMHDQYATPVDLPNKDITIVHLSNPLFNASKSSCPGEDGDGEALRKKANQFDDAIYAAAQPRPRRYVIRKVLPAKNVKSAQPK